MREKEAWTMDGVLGIFVIIILIGVAFYSFFYNQYALAIVFIILAIILGSGITLIQPNQAVVVIFLGRYIGSVRREGIVITVPFSKRQILSLRVRNFNSKRLKVNDINGNPIEIA